MVLVVIVSRHQTLTWLIADLDRGKSSVRTSLNLGSLIVVDLVLVICHRSSFILIDITVDTEHRIAVGNTKLSLQRNILLP